jgi:hypothetical protein
MDGTGSDRGGHVARLRVSWADTDAGGRAPLPAAVRQALVP